MNIRKLLFGTWKEESKKPVTGTYTSLLSKDYELKMILVVEVHSRTGKRRAYVKDCLGLKTYIDMDYIKEVGL